MQPCWLSQSNLSEVERHDLGQELHLSTQMTFPMVGMLDRAMHSLPSSTAVEETMHTQMTFKPFVSTNETPEAPIPLAGPSTAEVISALQQTISELQMQVTTLARAERHSSVNTAKPPPPAYEEQ